MGKIKEMKKMLLVLLAMATSFFITACSDNSGYDAELNNSIVDTKWYKSQGVNKCVLEFISSNEVLVYWVDSNNMYLDYFSLGKYYLEENKISFQDLNYNTGYSIRYFNNAEIFGSLLRVNFTYDAGEHYDIEEGVDTYIKM